MQDQSRRLSPQVIGSDTDSMNGLGTINAYTTSRTEATPEALQSAYRAMLSKQQIEVEHQATYKSAADAARKAEWEFHNAVLAIKKLFSINLAQTVTKLVRLD